VALSEAPEIFNQLFSYRFENGGLKGHSFGNIFLSAFEKVLGSFEKSLEEISKILNIKGEIIPITLDNVNLEMVLSNGSVLKGERNITPSEVIQPIGIKKFYIKPKPRLNSRARRAILKADAIIIGPGNLYTSLIPLFLVPDVSSVLKKTKAKIFLIVNLITKFGQTDNFSVFDFVNEVEKYLGKKIIDFVVFNTQTPRGELLKRYFRLEKSKPIIFKPRKLSLPEGAKLLSPGMFIFDDKHFLAGHFVANNLRRRGKADVLMKRNLIRHDYEKLGQFLSRLIFSLE
jgi:uncharacterized cofD-like protein